MLALSACENSRRQLRVLNLTKQSVLWTVSVLKSKLRGCKLKYEELSITV